MKPTLTLIAALTVLASCEATGFNTSVAPAADPVADSAMAVTRAALDGTTLPSGVTINTPIATALAECIAEHATTAELATIAANADPATTDATISTVLARPDTIGCATGAMT